MKMYEPDQPDAPGARSRPQAFMRKLVTSGDERAVALRFIGVGGSLLLAHIALATLFAALGLAPSVANITAHFVCIPPTYLAQRGFTFRSDAPHIRAFGRYVLLQLPLMGLGAGLAWLLITRMGWPAALGFVVIIPLVALVSYAAQRFWAFSHR
jgi:putative flippase GtrA